MDGSRRKGTGLWFWLQGQAGHLRALPKANRPRGVVFHRPRQKAN